MVFRFQPLNKTLAQDVTHHDVPDETGSGSGSAEDTPKAGEECTL